MRLGFLFGYVLLMWGLIVLGGFVLLEIVAPIELEHGVLVSSIFKAAVAISMVILWIWILVTIKNAYIRRRLVKK